MKKNFLKNLNHTSNYFWKKLKEIEKNYKEIIEIRGKGLFIGIKTKINNLQFCDFRFLYIEFTKKFLNWVDIYIFIIYFSLNIAANSRLKVV